MKLLVNNIEVAEISSDLIECINAMNIARTTLTINNLSPNRVTVKTIEGKIYTYDQLVNREI